MSEMSHNEFSYNGIKLTDLTSESVANMEPRERMEILEALHAHIISNGGQDVISPEEQRGALYLVRAQRVQGIRKNPYAKASAKEATSTPMISLDDFE